MFYKANNIDENISKFKTTWQQMLIIMLKPNLNYTVVCTEEEPLAGCKFFTF